MALMGGLIETGTEHVAGPHGFSVSEWMIRNAWALVVGVSVLFWAAVGAIFTFA